MSKNSYAPWIRSKLIEVGSDGTTAADLFHELKSEQVLGYPIAATYSSFARFWHWYKQLEWIEPTGETKPASPRGLIGKIEYEIRGLIHRYILRNGERQDILGLSPRVYYRITPGGQGHTDIDWINPLARYHPKWASGGEKKREYMREYMKEYRRKKRELLVRFGFVPHPQGRPRFSSGEK